MKLVVYLTLNNNTFTYTQGKILNATFGQTIQSDNTTPNWAVIGQYGSLVIKDGDGSLTAFLKTNKDNLYNIKCTYAINDTNNSMIYYIDKVYINNEERQVKLSLRDFIENFKTISFKSDYNFYNLNDFIQLVWELIDNVYSNENFYFGDDFNSLSDMADVSNVIIFNSFSSTNVYDLLNEICTLFHCAIILNGNCIEVVLYE